MSLFTYTAAELYSWVTGKEDIVIIDVRNSVDFTRFHLESPFPVEMYNIPYFDFIEDEEGCVARISPERRVRIVCAKESSARFVAEIFDRHGYADVGYLEGGIKTWATCWCRSCSTPAPNSRSTSLSAPARLRAATV